MPMYSYKCKDCGEAFDIRQEFTDSSLTECPRCGGTLRKLFSSVGITFKGSGFYRTDSRADSGSGSAGSSSPSTSSSDAGGSASSSTSGSSSSGSAGASSSSTSSAGANSGSSAS